MLFNRRKFICGASAVTVSAPALMRALATEADAAAGNTVLVIYEMNGGCDTINMVLPWDTPTYTNVYLQQRGNGNVGITNGDIMAAGTAFDATPGGSGTPFAMHPNFAPATAGATNNLFSLYKSGKVALLMGVGLPPNASSRDGHQQAQFYWQTGAVNNLNETTYGWAGLTADQLSNTSGMLPPLIAFDGSFQTALNGQKNGPLVIGSDMTNFNPNFGPLGNNNNNPNFGPLNMRQGSVALAGNGSYALNEMPGEFARALSNQTTGYVNNVQAIAKAQPLVDYVTRMVGGPNKGNGSGMKNQLKQVARSILGGGGSRVYYVRQGGYDTHTGQIGQQQQLFSELSESTAEFYQYVKAKGATQNVVLMTISDFGRRPYSNSGGGTDHGTATMHWVMGDIANGTGGTYFGSGQGVRATGYPDLQGGGNGLSNNLDGNGNIFVSFDFRYYLSSVIQYLGADPTKVLAAADAKYATVANAGITLAGGTTTGFNKVLGVS